jgi:hypothetical protein
MCAASSNEQRPARRKQKSPSQDRLVTSYRSRQVVVAGSATTTQSRTALQTRDGGCRWSIIPSLKPGRRRSNCALRSHPPRTFPAGLRPRHPGLAVGEAGASRFMHWDVVGRGIAAQHGQESGANVLFPADPTMRWRAHARHPWVERGRSIAPSSRYDTAVPGSLSPSRDGQLHPDVAPQVSHLRQVPLRISVKLPHSSQLSPS